MKATRKITKLRVGEMSLVGEGDNPHADVLILKHRDIVGVDFGAATAILAEVRKGATDLAEELSEGGFAMNIDELTQKLDGIEKALETAQTENATLKGQVEAITKERDAALAEVEKAKAAKPAEGNAEEELLKSLPQSVRDRIEKSEKAAADALEAVEKARDERELDAEVAKVRDTGLEAADKYGALIHRVRKGKSTAEDADALLDLVTKAKAVADGGSILFTTIGKHSGRDMTGDAADAEAKLNEAVEAIQKAKPSLTREQAYMEAIEANPSLYSEVRKIKPQPKG